MLQIKKLYFRCGFITFLVTQQGFVDVCQAYWPLTVYRDVTQLQLLNISKRDTLRDGSEGPVMIRVERGCFQMGSPKSEKNSENDERPQRQVCIKQAFYIGQYEVSFAEYDQFAIATKRDLPRDRSWGRNDQPVIDVSWEDALAYTEWLALQTGKKYRLPSEAEWEYVTRAGSTTAYWWGAEMQSGMAACKGCGNRWDGQQTAPVGSFAPNAIGLYDSAGNVYEWVQDCWHDNYAGAPSDGSAWQAANQGDCDRRVLRGGSWDSGPGFLRSANRADLWPGNHSDNIGFRLAQDLK